MDLILRNARVAGRRDTDALIDIGIERGRITHIGPRFPATGRDMDLKGALVAPGFIETHIHLDKSRLLDRCHSEEGTLDEAIAEVSRVKKAFAVEDVHRRGAATLEQAILHGTTHMRTHLEVDPGIGLRGFDGIRPLIDEYKWGIDLSICVFPQEGLLNNPGTDELMVEVLRKGARAVGAAPYVDSNPRGQIDRVFQMAREFDVDVDMHLDFGNTAESMDVEYVCAQTEKHRYGGRVTVGHVTKLSTVPKERFGAVARRLADAGVAVTVLPATDLFMMARHQEHSILRGVVTAHRLLGAGVNCSLSSNNILNPFTPFGDCSLIRMANLYANVCQVGKGGDVRECFEMITGRSARLLRLTDYGVEVGKQADLVVLDCASPESAVAEVVNPMYGFKRGRLTFTRPAAELQRP